MNNKTIYVAGEPLEDLRRALDGLQICDLPCGCLGFSGTLPRELSRSLERALKTIDAQICERADEELLDNEKMDSVRELLLRVGRSERHPLRHEKP
jgi:hypothetical protein